MWFRPMVDLFATRFNHWLLLFVSLVPVPEAWAVEAMSVSWENLLGYAFPPLPILGRVIRKAREESAILILLVPSWSSQLWFADLALLTHTPPFHLPLRWGSVNPAEDQDASRQSRPAPALHLVTVLESLLSSGDSERVSQLVSQSRRDSTENVYNYRWVRW